NVTRAGVDRLYLVRVTAAQLARQVVRNALRPLTRRIRTVLRDDRRQQRPVVYVFRRAHRHAPLPLRLRERLVRGELRRLHAVLRVRDDARATREAEPHVIPVAQVLGDVLLERLRGDRLEQPALLGAVQPPGVDGDE